MMDGQSVERGSIPLLVLRHYSIDGFCRLAGLALSLRRGRHGQAELVRGTQSVFPSTHQVTSGGALVVPRRKARLVWIGGILLLLLVIRLVGWRTGVGETAGRASTVDDHARYHDRSFLVTNVVDGDTLDLAVADGDRAVTRVRLWGVDTPEIAHGSEPAAYFGDEAHRFAEEMLTGRVVHVVLAPGDTRGKYGRLLAYIQINRSGEMFNEMLLSEGLAYADSRFDHPYRQAFLDIERRAERSAVGLWEEVRPAQMPPWRQRRLSRSR